MYNSQEFDTYGSGGLFRLNLNTIQVYFHNSTFTDIGAGWNGTNKTYGGVVLLESAGSLTVDSISVTNVYTSQNTTAGGGRFLYYNQNKATKISVTNSVFTCYTGYSTDTTVKTIVQQGKYDQGSLFQINSQTSYFEGLFSNN